MGRGSIAALALVAVALLQAAGLPSVHAEVIAARLWPAPDYTRMTIETRGAVKFDVRTETSPARLLLEIDGADLSLPLIDLHGRVAPDDPYIAALRASPGARPRSVRVTLTLKTEVRAQAFTLPPIARYGHRLVLDLYPLVAEDPLASLIEKRDQRDAAQREAQKARAATGATERLAMIVIDPGHGGDDPGALGRRGTREKDVTLIIARRLKALIDQEPGMRALLTRDRDYYLSLAARVEKARRARADLFVSVHADAFVRPQAHGSSVFALSERRATSEMARWLAKSENDADLIGGVNLDVKDRYLAQTLLDLSQTATIDQSLKLGRSVLAELGRVNTLHKPRVEQASFAVLKAPDVPSILIETAFISNPREERRLGDSRYQDRMARAILVGIKRYLKAHPPRPGETVAWGRDR